MDGGSESFGRIPNEQAAEFPATSVAVNVTEPVPVMMLPAAGV